MNRAVWIILNKDFSITIDGEISNNIVIDKKYSPGEDIWTYELPRLGFSDENVQKDYDDFIKDILLFFTEPQANQVMIDAKIGEESEYIQSKNPLIIRKIEEYEIIEEQ